MKKYLYLAILLCFASMNYTQAQSEQEQVIKTLNNFRKENSKKLFKLDSTLIETNKLIEDKNIDAKKFDKDSLRNLLQSNGNYDYNVEYTEISYFKFKKIENILKDLENEVLNRILNDSLYNNIGITVDKGLLNNKLKVIATQNYIQFDKEFKVEWHVLPGGDKISKIIPGNSKVDKLLYNTYLYDKNYKKTEYFKQPIIFEINNRFEIKIDITPFYGKPMDIEIIDSNGKTLSYIKNR